MTTPNELKAEFAELFEKQKAIENNSTFQALKNKHQSLKLESKYDLNTLSEIFQDPDLLARVSEDAFMLMKVKERESRVRNQFELVTSKKPQAKDVERIRLIANDEVERIKAVEENIKKEDKYISPIGPKKRRYLAEQGSEFDHNAVINVDTDSIIMRLIREVQGGAGEMRNNEGQENTGEDGLNGYQFDLSQFETDQLTGDTFDRQLVEGSATTQSGEDNNASQTDNTDSMDFTSNLALPDKSVSDITSAPAEVQEEEHPLEKAFKETALLVEQSPLKTVGSRYLYTLLPRQCDINAYKYVKEDYTPQNTGKNDERNSTDDTLITICVHNPANPNKKFQEIEILGSQKLSDFRDSIYCLSDFMSNGDKKDRLTDGEIINAYGEKLSPSLIYIDHVFYIDTRLKDNCYDELIDTWLTKKGVNKLVFKFEKKNMQDILIQDILLKLNQPYVFLHQDKCEHMIKIEDIRLISPNEYKSKSEFPRTTRNLKYDRFKCSMCNVFPATKVTEEYITTGFSPCYFCDNCFKSFHNENDEIDVKEYCGTTGGDVKRHRY